ncbi:MAG: amidohydrolase family protein [Mycobacteriales bacterium]
MDVTGADGIHRADVHEDEAGEGAGSAGDATRINLGFATRLSEEERRRRAILLEWLPPTLIDIHAHANGSHTVGELSAYGWRQVRSSFPTWSIADSAAVRQLLFGHCAVRMLRFAQPYKGIDHKAANAYLVANSPPGDAVALCGLPDNVSYTEAELRSGRYAALKMYPHYFEPPATGILDYFRPEAVEVAVTLGLPLILHLPKPLTDCIGELLRFAERFPSVRIVLAHLGRQTVATAATLRAFQLASTIPALTMDCSMASNVQVHRLALATLGAERVMFGSDEPMNLLRYVEFDHPTMGRRFVSQHPYHWLAPAIYHGYRHLAVGAVLLHFAVLQALRTAIADVYPGDEDRATGLVFRDNALRWFPALRPLT